jgi:hypothetical protein
MNRLLCVMLDNITCPIVSKCDISFTSSHGCVK